MKNDNKSDRRTKKRGSPHVRRIVWFAWVMAVIWTCILSATFFWYYNNKREGVESVARAEARAAFGRDMLYRRWASSHGGVYVPVTDKTQPNPYLSYITERDITTPSGKALTLINPAYMTRQVYELAEKQENVGRGHITSLNPLRPENAPDPWETKALQAFEKGVTEVFEVQDLDGTQYMRLMRPFVTDKPCLKCHVIQGYREGDIRGGISVSIPMQFFMDISRKEVTSVVAAHAVFWVLGISVIGFGARNLVRSSRAIEENELRYRTVADFTSDWEYWIAPDGSFRYISPSCEQVCGYSPEEFHADPQLLTKIIHPADQHLYSDHTNCLHKPFDCRIRTKGGEYRWISHGCRTIYDVNGQSLGQRASNRDITDRKHAEEENHRLNAELEQRVTERTAQLESANKELEAFCYSVSHDLRAPLRHIDGFVELLVSRYRNNLDDKGLHYVDTIATSARQMGVLIDDLLQFSRTGRTEMHKERMDMNKALQEALTQLKECNAGRNIEWVIADLPSVLGDYALLRQVWINLLGNAVKYTGTREFARIEVSASNESGEIIFVVADNGVGFDMKYADKLFGVFQRLHTQEEFEGTGIGLATVQRIINRHGGRVWAEAERDKGAKFYFMLPTYKEKNDA